MGSLEEKTDELFEEVMRLSIRADRLEEELGKEKYMMIEHSDIGEEADEVEASFHSEFSGGVLGSPSRKEFVTAV